MYRRYRCAGPFIVFIASRESAGDDHMNRFFMNRIVTLYRNSFSGLSPNTWWLSLVMLINRSGTMVLPFMTLYLTEKLDVGLGRAGIVVALWGVGAICGGILGGRLTDKFGFYGIQQTALLGGGLLFLILGQMHSYTLICIFTFLLSVVNESFRPANAAAVAHYSKPENRIRSISLNRLAINLGWALGGSLGGFIAARNYELLFIIDGCTNIFAGVLLWLLLAPSKNKSTAAAKDAPHIRSGRSAYKDKRYLAFVALCILFSYCFFQLFSTLPVYYKDKLKLNEEFIGITMALNGLIIALFEMVIVFSLEQRKRPVRWIPVGVLLIGASFVIFNIFPGAHWLALTSMLLCTLGEILSMPFMNTFWIMRSNDSNRGQYAGLYTVAWSVAQVLGPSTGARIAERWGFASLWWLVGAFSLLSAAGYYFIMLEKPVTNALPGTPADNIPELEVNKS